MSRGTSPGWTSRGRGSSASPTRRATATRLTLLAANPILVQRPIVITDDGRAVIGRPPEKILDLLS